MRATDPNPCPDPGTAPARPPHVLAILWLAKLVAMGFLGYAGYLKLSGAGFEIEMFEELGMEPGGRIVIGSLETVTAILILIPQSAIYGAFLGLGIMCGAVIAHLTKIGLDGIQLALAVAACCLTILYIRRHEAPFIRNLLDR